MKKVILILVLLLVSGCTTNYNLEIKENKFKESIDILINKSEIPTESYSETESDDQITPFLESKNSALFSNPNEYYQKKVKEFGEYYTVNMNYSYTADQFKDSNSLNLCFDGFIFEEDDENYYIQAYGNFYCLYSSEVTINITTKNNVVSNNANSIKGNVYTWVINDNNDDDVNIKFIVSKKNKYSNLLKYFIIIVPLLCLLCFVFYLFHNRNKNNEI